MLLQVAVWDCDEICIHFSSRATNTGCGCKLLELQAVSRHNPSNFHHCVRLDPMTQPGCESS